ncbi:MAG: hypothetical protein GY711_00025, partial [bacterium]|nr:hypothetical protein [bacterium]
MSDDSTVSALGVDSVESLRDPVAAVVALFPDVPGVDKKRGSAAHVDAAFQVADALVDPVRSFGPEAEAACRLLCASSVAEVEALRSKYLDEWLCLAESSVERSQVLRETAPPSVRSVLCAASPSGLQVGFVEALVSSLGWSDVRLVEHLVNGFPLVGPIPVAHGATSIVVRSATQSPASLRRVGCALGRRLVNKQRRVSLQALDPAGEVEIWQQTIDDVARGRMAPLVEVDAGFAFVVSPSRRFAVRQVSSTGKSKIRTIDDLSESLVNEATSVVGKIRMSSIADLVAQVDRLHRAQPGRPVRLVKADFSSAYRSCPVAPDHLDFAQVLVALRGQVSRSVQWAMPFGAVAAVYAWDRLAALVTAAACRGLVLAVNRYVDDLFFVDFADTAVASRQRLFALAERLGLVLAVEKTPEPSVSLEILGVFVDVSEPGHVVLSLVQAKVELWLLVIDDAVLHRRLSPRECERLVGRLSFAVGAVWGPCVRSRLVALYRHVGLDDFVLGSDALEDLRWWSSALRGALSPRRYHLGPPRRPPV